MHFIYQFKSWHITSRLNYNARNWKEILTSTHIIYVVNDKLFWHKFENWNKAFKWNYIDLFPKLDFQHNCNQIIVSCITSQLADILKVTNFLSW